MVPPNQMDILDLPSYSLLSHDLLEYKRVRQSYEYLLNGEKHGLCLISRIISGTYYIDIPPTIDEYTTYRKGIMHGLKYTTGKITNNRVFMYNGKKHGRSERFDVYGRSYECTTYQFGKLHGPYRYWSNIDCTTIGSSAYFVNGKMNGLSLSWHKNGQLAHRTNYRDGKRHGLHESWYDNGDLDEQCEYVDGCKKETQ